jgi:hypothetical protein
MGWACGMYGTEATCIIKTFWCVSLEERGHLEDPGGLDWR